MRVLFEVLRNLFRKPATRLYPKEEVKLPYGFRGKIVIDISRCIFCKACEKICPTEAINVNKEGKTISLDLAKCIFCEECLERCPKNAIKQTREMLVASEEKQKLTFK